MEIAFNLTELEMILRILISVGLGGLIGFEREMTHKPAGLRTHIFVCMGSCLFTITSFYLLSRGEFESFEEFGLSVLQRLQQNAVDMLAEMATQELFGALSGGGKDSGGSGGWLNTAGNLIGGIVGLFGEKGLAYNAAGPGVTFMARGGVFNRPFAVPMANGGVAIGSEYGQEEAIMPLARTSSGHLGVRSQKDRGAQIVNNTHNTWEVKAIDPKSFADVCERNPQAIIGPLNSELERGNKDLISNLKMIKGG